MARALILLLFMVPSAGAALEIHLDVTVPLGDTPDLIRAVDADGQGSALGCTEQGTIEATPVGGGFRFSEPMDAGGCAEAVYKVPIPVGAHRAQVAYEADRIVRPAVSGGLSPSLRQEFVVHGSHVTNRPIYDPAAPSMTTQAHAHDITLTDATQLQFGWLFADEGETGPTPIEAPAQAEFSASVHNHKVVFDVPVEPTQSTQYMQADTRTQLERQTARFSVPATAAGSTTSIVFSGERPVELDGPEGAIDTARLAAGPDGWTFAPAPPGQYAATTEAVTIGNPVSFAALPFIVGGVTALSASGAVIAQSRWASHAHWTQSAGVRGIWIALGAGVAAILAIMLWALLAGMPLLQEVPLGPTAWSVYFVLSLLTASTAAATVHALVQRRRAAELHHQDSMAQTNAQLARSNQELEEFAAVASHDLRAPLRRIVGCTQILERQLRPGLEDEQRFLMESVVENGIHMQRLVTDLLDLSRLQQKPFAAEPVALQPIMERILHDLRPEIESGGVTIHLAADLTVQGMPTLLREMFHNLVGNAIKYRRADEPRVEIEATADGDWVDVEIRDNGPGIDVHDQPRIFQMFHRGTAAGHEGSGIGLAIVKRIAELHGGLIEVASTPGKGSTFRVRLPRGVVPPTPTNVR